MTGKIVISEAMDAYRVAKEYVSGLYLSPELVMNGNQPKYCLANFYRTPNYRNKAGGVCFVFEYRSAASSAPEYYRIYVKCFSAKRSIVSAASRLPTVLLKRFFPEITSHLLVDVIIMTEIKLSRLS